MSAIARLVLTPAGSGAFLLRRGVYRVGRTPECDVFLDDATVSRRHATLTVAEDVATVLDHGSRNGTFVDGLRVDEGDLRDGAEITFGSVTCTYERVDPGVEDESTVCGGRYPVPPEVSITVAEHRVFDLLLAGHSEKAIAIRLCLSRHTVHNHVKRIYLAFDVHTRPELLSVVLTAPQRRPMKG